jgi:hypothetical protein
MASRAPRSVVAPTRLAGLAFDHTADGAHGAARAELVVLSISGDHTYGIAAFADRRDPKFTRS